MFTLPYTEPFIPTAIAQTLERVLWIYSSERRGTHVCRQNILNHTVIIQMATHITISVTIFALLFVFLHIVQPVLRETFHRGNNVRQKIGAVSPLVFWRSRRVQPGATLLRLCCVISLCSGRLTLCAFAGDQPPRPPVFPPHFNSLFCLPLLSSVRQQLSPSFSACKEPLFNHSDILSACRNLLFWLSSGVCGGGIYTWAIKLRVSDGVASMHWRWDSCEPVGTASLASVATLCCHWVWQSLVKFC